MLNEPAAPTSLYCPLPPAQNPHAYSAGPPLHAWLSHHGLLGDGVRTRLERSRVVDFVSRAYPDADPIDLEVVLQWTTWAFLADDRADDHLDMRDVDLLDLSARYESYAVALESGKSSSLECAPLTALHTRILERSSPDCLRRFSSAVRTWFQALHWEVSNRVHDTPPTLDEYIVMRRKTVGMRTEYSLFELTHKVHDPYLFEDPLLDELMDVSSNLIAWANDIFSVEKEFRHGDPHNLVLLLQSECGHDRGSAIAVASEMHNGEMDRFLSLERQALGRRTSSVATLRFIDMLKCWIRSNVDWSLRCERYSLGEQAFVLTTVPPPRHSVVQVRAR
ncbi:MAG TPA: hypothetical protein VHM70_00120, partial [Polyangiaceae bacterium]|nr:hypothetical protein [Polyangiaceae bacterium]